MASWKVTLIEVNALRVGFVNRKFKREVQFSPQINVAYFMINTRTESMAMTARKDHRPHRNHRPIPVHPDYQDEISEAQIEAIRSLADPDGKRASKRVLMYPSLT